MVMKKLAVAAAVLVGRASCKMDAHDAVLMGTPIEDKQDTPSKEDYEKALRDLDVEAVKSDMQKLLTDSQDFWPADFGWYGGLMVRLAWHCSGSYRASDGAGGCGGGRQRFEPERSWPDNTNLDKARALVAPLKEKYGDGLSWGDLFVLAGTTALRDAGAPIKKMCFGRVDDNDGSKSTKLGPTALQVEQTPCKKDGDCQYPLGDTTLGLIYVNPEGPMGVPKPEGSVKNIRQTFGIMGHSDKNTVALIGGGHAVGKGHGACKKGAGKLPKDAYADGKDELPWQGQCGSGDSKGKGDNTATAGFEGAFTTKPTKWDNEYFQKLLHEDWEKHKGPGGHWQWRIKNSEGDDSKLMRLTSDIALLHDPEYKKFVQKFADDMDAFNDAFDEAWFDLTTRFGSGTWADNAKCDDGEFDDSLRHVEDPDVSKYKPEQLWMLNDDFNPPAESSNTGVFIAVAGCAMVLSAVIKISFRRRSSQTQEPELLVEDAETETLVA